MHVKILNVKCLLITQCRIYLVAKLSNLTKNGNVTNPFQGQNRAISIPVFCQILVIFSRSICDTKTHNTSFESSNKGQYNSRRTEVWHYQGQVRPTVCKKSVIQKELFYSSMALFFCHMKTNSQSNFTSKTAKINHIRSNSNPII